MWTRPSCIALLLVSVALDCGARPDLEGSFAPPPDGGATPVVTATRDAGGGVDASATVDAAAILEPGATGGGAADAAACKIPASASSVEAGASCQPLPADMPDAFAEHFPGAGALCGSYFYVMGCTQRATPDSAMGCFPVAGGGQGDTAYTDYCCPCEGVSACVNVDLTPYDRSCRRDSDCVGVFGGTLCAGQCECFHNGAINVDGLAQYQEATAPQYPPASMNCHGCSPSARVSCIEGLCRYSQ
jgi:hypothetical protein